jgi:hypothetical protein
MTIFSKEELGIITTHQNESGVWLMRNLQKHHPEIFTKLKSLGGKNPSETMYLLNHTKGKCKTCASDVTFDLKKNSYRLFCSTKCSRLDSTSNDKRKATCLQKYGVDNPAKSATVQQKMQATLQLNYGDNITNPSQVSSIVDQKMERYLLKTGYSHWSKNPEYQEAKKQKCVDLYGVVSINQSHISPEVIQVLNDRAAIHHLWDQYRSTERIAEELAVSQHRVYLACRDFEVDLKTRISYPELALVELITNETSLTIVRNSRSIIAPMELDIYLPDIKVAIEFCGLYWHCESKRPDRHYHQNKLKACEEQGIRLVTIFGDEWFKNRKICENRLRHILKIGNSSFGARNCKVREITSSVAVEFQNSTHIQGGLKSKHNYGAYHNDTLVAVMSFSPLRKSLGHKIEEGAYELTRFSSESAIPGLASKMLSKFKKEFEPERIISYCDLRWGTGIVYEKMGFSLKTTTSPGYWYVENYTIRHHRFKFRKSELVKNGCPVDTTERQWMKSQNYDVIWDCGTKLFEWNKHGKN